MYLWPSSLHHRLVKSIATAVPEVYPKIVTAFADAVKCMDRASEGEWGHRPSLKNGAVRVRQDEMAEAS